MARAVVIGGGFGGMAAAARLAKLGHAVTLVERADTLGGALGSESADGFTWDSGPTTTLLPAVVRDLFRKSGRPLERELALVPLDIVREHRFADGSVVSLPGASRVAQRRAVEQLGAGLGRTWVEYVDSLAEDWELLRRHYLERPYDAATAPDEVVLRLGSRRSLQRRLRAALPDERLRLLAAHPVSSMGQDTRRVPDWMGIWPFVEQRFGAWTIDGGMAVLAGVLGARLATRGVEVLTRTEARDLVVRQGRVAAVRTDGGELDAEVVVCAVDPRRLPALASYVARTRPAAPPHLTHVGLSGESPFSAPEVVLHGDPSLVVRAGAAAPEGMTALTLLTRGGGNALSRLAECGVEVRDRVVSRLEFTPPEQIDRRGGSPYGVLWRGRATLRRRLGPGTPIPGVYAAGAHATPGAGLPFVGLSAALVAQAVTTESGRPDAR